MDDHFLVTLVSLANRLRVPLRWLKAEALAGRIPHLRAGRRLLFDYRAVEQELLRRASKQGRPKSGGDAG